VRRICYYHAGCPDGFGAAWAVWRAWGREGRYLPRGHDDALDAMSHQGDRVVFADIAPSPRQALELGELAACLIVLDHHLTARDLFAREPSLIPSLSDRGHHVRFDLDHSGAVLAWQYFHPDEPVPPLLAYVEDQDLWSWELPETEAVNAAIGSYPRDLETWDALARRPVEELAAEGAPILRAQRIEVERSLRFAHPVRVGELRVEAVNALQYRSHVGHELAKRAAYGHPIGIAYRVFGTRVDVSIYSIGEVDVAGVAVRFQGGGHRNASGFSVGLQQWLDRFVGRTGRGD
jgi:oligoribonuclease NrnB/cAMP/cGMP phosphodiesterase (DHH superfamily)